MNKHKAVIIPDNICQTNKIYFRWLIQERMYIGIYWPFMDAISWSTTVRRCSFLMIYFQIDKNLVIEFKHVTCPTYIITFNAQS